MAADISQIPWFEDGHYTDKGWVCGCGLPPRWLTSKIDASKGQKFLRCQQTAPEQCRFFLWERDEVAARDHNASHSSQAPQTPTRNELGANEPPIGAPKQATAGPPALERPTNTVTLPTPETGNRLFVDNNATSRSTTLQSPDASPTPRRFHGVPLKLDDETNLSTNVLQLLRSDNVRLRVSTEIHLRHIITMAEDVYEMKLRKFEATVSELRKRLDELEKEPISRSAHSKRKHSNVV